MCPPDEKAARQLRELQVKLDDFERVKLIGRGAYGEVRLVSPGTDFILTDITLETTRGSSNL